MKDEVQNLLVEELKDAYSAEKQALRCMQKALRKASAPALRDGIQLHIDQTQTQIERVETAMEKLEVRPGPGATVATPLAWDEVSARLTASVFTVQTVPTRVAKLPTDPWQGFGTLKQRLPDLVPSSATPTRTTRAAPPAKPGRRSVIVHAASPKSRR